MAAEAIPSPPSRDRVRKRLEWSVAAVRSAGEELTRLEGREGTAELVVNEAAVLAGFVAMLEA
jgi:hypothetical protein